MQSARLAGRNEVHSHARVTGAGRIPPIPKPRSGGDEPLRQCRLHPRGATHPKAPPSESPMAGFSLPVGASRSRGTGHKYQGDFIGGREGSSPPPHARSRGSAHPRGACCGWGLARGTPAQPRVSPSPASCTQRAGAAQRGGWCCPSVLPPWGGEGLGDAGTLRQPGTAQALPEREAAPTHPWERGCRCPLCLLGTPSPATHRPGGLVGQACWSCRPPPLLHPPLLPPPPTHAAPGTRGTWALGSHVPAGVSPLAGGTAEGSAFSRRMKVGESQPHRPLPHPL